jgi:hypothetical protein
MRRFAAVVVLMGALVVGVVASSSSAGTPVRWTQKNMLSALRAIGYPKPHPKKLTCKARIVPAPTNLSVKIQVFFCTATYRHGHRLKAVVAGDGEGGWICAGKTLGFCRVLSHGFVTTSQVGPSHDLQAAAARAGLGYMDVRHNTPNAGVVDPCATTAAMTYSCVYSGPQSNITVTLVFKKAKGGYLVSGTG